MAAPFAKYSPLETWGWMLHASRAAPAYWTTPRVYETVAARTDGIDKIMKCIQYIAKTSTWFIKDYGPKYDSKNSVIGVATSQMDLMASHLSGMRKVIRLGKWIYSLPVLRSHLYKLREAIQREETTDEKKKKQRRNDIIFYFCACVNAALAVITDFCDDTGWTAKHGIIEPHVGTLSSYIAPRTWFATTIFDLYFTFHDLVDIQKDRRRNEQTGLTAEAAVHREKEFLCLVTFLKYAADFCAAIVDALELNVSKGIVPVSSLLSGFLGTYKLIYKAEQDVAKQAARAPSRY